MGSLNNLYISQSYQGLLHFGSNTASVAQLGIIEDGLGNSLGLYLNNGGDLRTTTSVSSSTIEANNLKIKNKIELTGSIDIDGPVTASSAFIENDLIVSGTLYAKEVHTLIESSSIIFSSGSNILGDSTADIQTLNGKVIVSGSEEITGSLFVRNDISSSTLNGIGNVTAYSQSVSASILSLSQSVSASQHEQDITSSYLYGPFSQSVDFRLDQLELFTGSQGLLTTASFNAYTASIRTELNTIEVTTASLNAFTQSANNRLNNLETTTASLNNSVSLINSFTQSTTISLTALNANSASVNNSVLFINAFTSSANGRLNSLEAATSSYAISSSVAGTITALSTSIQITDNALTVRINDLASFTGSYATTGSNTFRGNQIITGSLSISSSAAVDVDVVGRIQLTGSLGLSGSMDVLGNMVYSGSVRGNVTALSISANTASMDCSLGNFFTITLNSAGSVRIVPTNIKPGETLTLRLTQPAGGFSSVVLENTKYPTGYQYSATPQANAEDVITFLSFDSASLYYSRANQFIS